MTEGRCSPSEYHLTNTDSVLIPGKPRCTSYYLKLWHLYMYLLLVHYVSGIVWNLSCMISRLSWSYTSMCMAIVLLRLIDFGRSRVISCHSRAIGQKSSNFWLLARFLVIFIFQYMRYGMQYGMNGNLRPDGGMMMRYRYGNRTGFLVS